VSRSLTEGTSETVGTSSGETEGRTRGTSQSRTAGSSETIQKRALVTPDEIGFLFARIDDRAHRGYPGFVLAVISGARPVALRRVNYYEDFQFIGRFDPHPDHPLIEPQILTVDASGMGKYLALFREDGLEIKEWQVSAGQMVAAGEAVALIATEMTGTPVTVIKAPRAGMIGAVHNTSPMPAGPLFSLRFYADGGELTDPFSDFPVWQENAKKSLTRIRAQAQQSLAKTAGVMTGCALLAILFCFVVQGNAPIVIGAILPFVVPRAIRTLRAKVTTIKECGEDLKKYCS
jgi:hypothetical protein